MSAEEHKGTSRGEFLARTAGVSGFVVGAGLWTAKAAPAATAAPAARSADPRSFTAGRFALELDGAYSGSPASAEGGNTYADVIVEDSGSSFFSRKHIGNVKYEDITIQVGFSMTKGFYEWIAASWDGKAQRKSGAVLAADLQGSVQSRREFRDALITETTIPALDASSKDAAYMTLTFSPESVVNGKPGGTVQSPTGQAQKAFLPSNFRFEIKGLDTSRVSKIDSFTIKQGIVTGPIGGDRLPQREPGKLEFPNLTVTLSQDTSKSWYDWFDDFVIRGNNGQESEKSGELSFLNPNLKDVLGKVKFFNLGIFKISQETSGSESIKRVKVELYCESMQLDIPGV